MSLPLSQLHDEMAADFLLVDGLQTAILREPSEDGTIVTEITIPNCLRRAADKDILLEDRESDRIITERDIVTWHVPSATLIAIDKTPQKGWTIEGEDGVLWVVRKTGTVTFHSRFALVCIKV